MTPLREKVLKRDWSTLDHLGAVDASDVDDLRRLAAHASREVRELALAASMRPLLADRRDAVNIALSHAPYFLRVSDVAVGALAKLLAVPLGFEVDPPRRYTDAELSAAASAR